jgi:anti-anti-sigma regulatory factor
MDMTSRQAQGRVPVTVLQLEGKLDGSNYNELIEEVKMIYHEGVRDLLLDLSRLTYLSSAGIAAIHKAALIFRGVDIPEEESGWASFHAIDRDRDNGVQKHVKLFSPLPEVANILDITGFKTMFEIHSDLDKAVASF